MLLRVCIYFVLSAGIGFAANLQGQESKNNNIHLADSILRVRGEVSFTFDQDRLFPELISILSIDHFRDDKAYAYANAQSFRQFLKSNIPFSLLEGNFTRNRLKKAGSVTADALYPSYPDYLALMQQFQDKYPQLCTNSDIGLSVSGRKIKVIHLIGTTGTGTKPVVFLTSSMHGDELTGFRLMLWLIDYMLSNYNKNALVTTLMNEADIWINPLSNPDGCYHGGDNTVTEATRFNANSIDLNRNYPDPSDGDHPDYNEWQPENVAMMKFCKEKKINLSVNFHTGTEVVNYPWDTWPRSHPDNAWYRHISRQYADSARLISNNSYLNVNDTGFENGIVDGYYWYRVTGGRQDYMNYFHHSREVTIELSEEGLPDSATLSNYWKYNRPSMLRYIEQSLFGIQGTVTDSVTGAPLLAKVEVLNHDADNSYIYSDSATGSYIRYLAAGTYSLKYTATGYKDYTIDNISVYNEKKTSLNIRLSKSGELTGLYPNPFTSDLTLEINRNQTGDTDFEINVFNMQGRKVYTTISTIGNYSQLKIFLTQLSKGIYIVTVDGKQYHKTYKLLKQ